MYKFLERIVDIVFICLFVSILEFIIIAVDLFSQRSINNRKNYMCWQYQKLAAFISNSVTLLHALKSFIAELIWYLVESVMNQKSYEIFIQITT